MVVSVATIEGATLVHGCTCALPLLHCGATDLGRTGMVPLLLGGARSGVSSGKVALLPLLPGAIFGRIGIAPGSFASTFLCKLLIIVAQLLQMYPVCNCERSTAVVSARFAIREVSV